MKLQEFCQYVKNIMKMRYPNAEVFVNKMVKDNDLEYYGLSILEDREKEYKSSPCIYLEPYFEDFMCNRNLYEICEDIINNYELHKNSKLDSYIKEFSFEKIKDSIFLEALNTKKNNVRLNQAGHEKVYFEENDLSFVYYIRLPKLINEMSTIIMTKQIFESFHITLEELKRTAIENMLREVELDPMENIISEIAENQNLNIEQEIDESLIRPMFVLTNKERINGAGYLGITEYLEEISRTIHDFYILPSSIHELILIPKINEGVNAFDDIQELKRMVHEVNEMQVCFKEFLSNNIYFYSYEIGRVQMF